MNKTHPTSRRLVSTATAVTLWLSLSAVALAADKTWEIKPGDSLSIVVSKEYSDYGNRRAIMDAIFKASPDAFINNNINRLKVGKTLKLPAADSIPDLKPSPPPTPVSGGISDEAFQKKLQELQAQRDELEETVKLLEDENAQLQELIQGYEEAKKAKDEELAKLEARIKELEANTTNSTITVEGKSETATQAPASGDMADLQKRLAELEGENIELQTQLETAKMDLADSQALTEEIKTQLSDLQRQNDALNNDLQQARAAATVAENSAAGASRLPWILLGLMALLMLPLMWLLKRNRDEPSITTIPAPPKPAPVPRPTPAPVTETVIPVAPTKVQADEQLEAIEDTGPEDPDSDLKLDIARAYLDLRNPEAAADMLKDVLEEGGTRQKREAREILSFIS